MSNWILRSLFEQAGESILTWTMMSRLVIRTTSLYFGELYLFLAWATRRFRA